MNTEQERADFEAWIASPPYEKPLGINPEASGFPGQYRAYEVQLAWEAYQAGRAALQSQDREDAGVAEIMREAAQIISAISPEHAPDNIRWPIVDELEGFASKINHARRVEGES